jgi:two-component system, cell cycle response regulator DivK
MPTKILIADDYEDNRDLLCLILERAGHIIRVARNGNECVEMAFESVPDVALIDLSMPGLDGLSVLRKLRSFEKTRNIKCIALTGFDDVKGCSKYIEAGFDAFMSKPFVASELLSLIHYLTRES